MFSRIIWVVICLLITFYLGKYAWNNLQNRKYIRSILQGVIAFVALMLAFGPIINYEDAHDSSSDTAKTSSTKTSDSDNYNEDDSDDESGSDHLDDSSESDSEDYQSVTYDQLTDDNGKSLLNENVQITGTISKVQHDQMYTLIVNMNDDPAEKVMVVADDEYVDGKPSTGDKVTIKGSASGMQKQPEELTGGENVPFVICDQDIN